MNYTEYYLVVIKKDFKFGNMADYVFALSADIIEHFRDMDLNYDDCDFHISQHSDTIYKNIRWCFDDLTECLVWLEDLLVEPITLV